MSISFFFPYHDVSGVPVLFLSVAQHIADHYPYRVRIVDFPDGYMARNLPRNSAVALDVFTPGVPFIIDESTTLVMQSILPYAMRPELRIGDATRVVFWHLFPHNLASVLLPIGRLRTLQFKYREAYKRIMQTALPTHWLGLREYVRLLVQESALIFYDLSSLQETEEMLDVRIDSPVIVPVPIEIAPSRRFGHRIGDPLRVCWVGRLEGFKMPILHYCLNKFAEWAERQRRPVEFYVVGDGGGMEHIDQLARGSPVFELRKVGTLEGRPLDELLVQRIDLVTAMGSSALHAARLGIPVLLLDFSYDQISGDYRFRWLFEAKQYDLGHFVTREDFEDGNDSLGRAIQALYDRYDDIAHWTYRYCEEHHSMSVVVDRLVSAISHTRLRFGRIPLAIRRKGPLRRIYDSLMYSDRSTIAERILKALGLGRVG